MGPVPHDFTSRSASIAIGSVVKLDSLTDVKADAAGPVGVGVVDEATEIITAATPGPGLL